MLYRGVAVGDREIVMLCSVVAMGDSEVVMLCSMVGVPSTDRPVVRMSAALLRGRELVISGTPEEPTTGVSMAEVPSTVGAEGKTGGWDNNVKVEPVVVMVTAAMVSVVMVAAATVAVAMDAVAMVAVATVVAAMVAVVMDAVAMVAVVMDADWTADSVESYMVAEKLENRTDVGRTELVGNVV